MSRHLIEQLKRLLETEKELLLSGELASVSKLVPEKEALARALEARKTAELAPLSALLQENGRLLTAAKSGVSQVLETLKQQRAARTSLSTYDATGAATNIGSPKNETLRRY